MLGVCSDVMCLYNTSRHFHKIIDYQVKFMRRYQLIVILPTKRSPYINNQLLMASSYCNNEIKPDGFHLSIDLRDRRGLSHLDVCLSNKTKVKNKPQREVVEGRSVLADQNVSSERKFDGSPSPVNLQTGTLTAAIPLSVSSASPSYSGNKNKAEFHRSRRAAEVKSEVFAETENANNTSFFWV